MHPVAEIFRKEVKESPFSFKHVSKIEGKKYTPDFVWESNGLFPKKNGYPWYDGRTFFFWKDYSEWSPYDEHKDDPEYMYSRHHDYVYDGTTKYWDEMTPKYDEFIAKALDCIINPVESAFAGGLPPKWHAPYDETPCDSSRRYVAYMRNTCIWGLQDCECYGRGPCNYVETHGPRCCCGFGCDPNKGERVYSLGTDIDNTLTTRMVRLGWKGEKLNIIQEKT